MYGYHKKLAAVCAAAVMLTGHMLPVSAEAAEEEKTSPTALMCLGDSITDGFWLAGGYRNTLCAQIQEHHEESKVDFVGPNWGGIGYDPQHAGYSGYSIDNIAQEQSISGQRTGLYSFIDWLMESYPADVVFLQIGTNDILSLYDLEHFGERLELLVDAILETLPEDGMLYLATLPCMDATNNLYISDYYFTVESMDAAVEACNGQIRELAQKKQEKGAKLRLAEVNRVLTKEDLYDGVHPSEAGYEKLGLFWYRTLEGYWKGEAAYQAVRGDINADGALTAADAVLMVRHLTNAVALGESAGKAADMDGDGKVNVKDLMQMKSEMLRK